VFVINEIILEGIVVRDPWKFMDDLFFRLVTYRDSDLPAKKLDLERDAGDYVNARVNGGANGLIHIRRGMRLRVHGYLQSRDFHESLEDFVAKARKSKICTELAVEVTGVELKTNQVLIDRNLVELVAKRIIVLDATAPNNKRTRTTTFRPANGEFDPDQKSIDSEDLARVGA
jgi:hypothetical protein